MDHGLKDILIDDYLDFNDQYDYQEETDDEDSSIILTKQDDFHMKIVEKDETKDFYLRQLLNHRFYDYFMAIVVVSSSITLGLSLETDETYLNNRSRQITIYILDEILMSILFLEFLFKFYLDSMKYWTNWTNLYDFIIIFFGSLEIVWSLFSERDHSTVTNVLKGFRLLQLIRLYRIIKLSEGLQVLTKSLIKTVLTYTFSVSILLFLSIYVIAVIGQMLYGREEQSPWHHFSTSMIIIMRLILVDNWNIIGPDLERQGSPTISRWFLVIVVFVGNRIVTNVLVGLMIESVSSVNDDFIKERREKKIRRHQKKREELSKKTFDVLNTRLSDQSKPGETKTIEQMKSNLSFIQNQLISPSDLLFSLDWLEKLIQCGEKMNNEGRTVRYLMIEMFELFSKIVEENLRNDERSSMIKTN